ncbi:MAG TPA: PEP/pyruvate-binding domain-containing protein [Myxococcota bacterium]|nr:PEP/pyruvate-binding domain-containing protein [Myxococcota bacterium]HRY96376.1 PEP/pyruvate-binding domain-containing protein [Myxococcota bacterium]HSA20819.1 PEP/pyruvate-binding domain-containing protein [Myxococcota bacterium]
MSDKPRDVDEILLALRERAKELSCLYAVEEALAQPDRPLDEALAQVLRALGPGLKYPEVAAARIELEERLHQLGDFAPTPWELSAELVAGGRRLGRLRVFYLAERPAADQGPFLNEEVRLVRTVAERLAQALEQRRLREPGRGASAEPALSWRASLELLRRTDKGLYLRIVRKLVNHLWGAGNREAQTLLDLVPGEDEVPRETNQPGQRKRLDDAVLLGERPLEIAARALPAEELLGLVQKWMKEDKASFFLKVLDRFSSTQPEIADALRRFHEVLAGGGEISQNVVNGLRVSLIRRLLTEQLEYIVVAKEYLETRDFEALFDHLVVAAESHGKVGGKSAGLFLAQRILDKVRVCDDSVSCTRIPKTWYVASDGLNAFIRHNDLEEVMEQKYKPIDQVRREYPNLVQLFKSSRFPPELVHGLALALDDFGDRPLIVRSSSLLEDRLGTAFSGKYKSLFLANQGERQDRLAALVDAVAEIYASVFSPDPIEYRRDRGLLDFNEEMGLLLQEVVGRRAGDYFLPAFAGVAFSNNEFRWSPRIKRHDGLVRLVPGLGTRAVDRVPDDYPVLAVPRQPALRSTVSTDERVRYAPQKVDLINLRTNSFETVAVEELIRQVGTDYPGLEQVFSVLEGDLLKPASRMLTDPARDRLVVTFDRLLGGAPFLRQVGRYLELLEERLGTPVDIEFAHDGTDFYLLQCRPQCHADDSLPAPIPRDVPREDMIFGARRHVSNGWVPDITHVVYVDPQAYGELPSRAELIAVGRAVGKLNQLLPKRRFILMGPGRWGSQGDIKLGVNVTYSDISNTAMLIEIARRKGSYLPDLSFGTHFFQDLVEARIRYLPLYPDEDGVPFHEEFLRGSPSVLEELLPEYAHLAGCLRVIDVPGATGGKVLRVLQNAEQEQALAFLAEPGGQDRPTAAGGAVDPASPLSAPANHWSWRLRMAESLAAAVDQARFGVAAMWVFGSTKNGTAGPGSDIDLLIHFRGDGAQREALLGWLDGWSLALAEVNFLRTGVRLPRLLDVVLVGDDEVKSRAAFAQKIGAVTDPARPLPLGQTIPPPP